MRLTRALKRAIQSEDKSRKSFDAQSHPKQNKISKAWDVANKPICIWALSSIIVGLLTSYYQSEQQILTERSALVNEVRDIRAVVRIRTDVARAQFMALAANANIQNFTSMNQITIDQSLQSEKKFDKRLILQIVDDFLSGADINQIHAQYAKASILGLVDRVVLIAPKVEEYDDPQAVGLRVRYFIGELVRIRLLMGLSNVTELSWDDVKLLSNVFEGISKG